MFTNSYYANVPLVIILSEAYSLVDWTGKARVNNIL